jgi:transcriptional regulator with XRE-family HTH domain
MPPSRASIKAESTAHLRRVELRVGEQIRDLRRDAGVSVTTLANAVGVHRTHLARIEAGATHPSLQVLSAIGIALGAEVGVRYFAGVRPRIRDRFQAPMIETLVSELDDRWRVQIEVPVTTPRRGVIDLVLDDNLSPTTVSTEANSQIGRLEEQIRWSNEKALALASYRAPLDPSGPVRTVSRLLVLRSTVDTREIAIQYAATLRAAYPARCEDVIAALTMPTAPWPGAGIVWIQVDGPRVRLLPGPPRGVALGR